MGRRMMKVEIERTRKGHPALWERGGGYSNTGVAQIICGERGEPLSPIYVRRRGHLANGSHALFVIRPGYHVIQADHHREDFYIKVLSVVEIEGDEAICNLVSLYSEGEWEPPLPNYLTAAVKAAVEKATCYHCRSPHYVEGRDLSKIDLPSRLLEELGL